MKQKDKIWDYYANSLVSAIEEVIHSDRIETIRDTHLIHAYAKINQFEKTYKDTDLRRWFIEKLLNNISNAEDLLIDKEEFIKTPRFNLLQEIKYFLKNTFKDLKINEKHLTAPEKVILFEYLGILNLLREKGMNETNMATLLTLMWGGSHDNLKDFIRKVNLRPGKGNPKNEKSLSTVKQVIEKLDLEIIREKIQEDLDLLKKKR